MRKLIQMRYRMRIVLVTASQSAGYGLRSRLVHARLMIQVADLNCNVTEQGKMLWYQIIGLSLSSGLNRLVEQRGQCVTAKHAIWSMTLPHHAAFIPVIFSHKKRLL